MNIDLGGIVGTVFHAATSGGMAMATGAIAATVGGWLVWKVYSAIMIAFKPEKFIVQILDFLVGLLCQFVASIDSKFINTIRNEKIKNDIEERLKVSLLQFKADASAAIDKLVSEID